MNRHLKILFSFSVIFTILSCKKQAQQPVEKQEYTQYFNALVDSIPIQIKNSFDKDRSNFMGSWTGVGMKNGDQMEMYTVKAVLPKEQFPSKSVLNFQIFDIKRKAYHINSNYLEAFSTHIFLVKNAGTATQAIYTTNDLKKPFEIEITKYEFPNGRHPPIVGGKLNGVLYNEKSTADSISIYNGNFEVRFW